MLDRDAITAALRKREDRIMRGHPFYFTANRGTLGFTDDCNIVNDEGGKSFLPQYDRPPYQ